MNYYPFHVGDYATATRHLSWDEDAAYRRLLDVYYTTEKPLPMDHRAVCRLVLATTDAQREAVRVVLEEFFEATEEGWVNHRADREIEAMQERQEKQRQKANAMWEKRRSGTRQSHTPEHGIAPALPRHESIDAAASGNDADAMPPTPTPTPTPIEPPSGDVASKSPRPARKAPASFLVTPELQQWAREKVPDVDIRVETAKLRDHTFKTAITDWPGAWRNWMRRAADDTRGRRHPTTSRAPSLSAEEQF